MAELNTGSILGGYNDFGASASSLEYFVAASFESGDGNVLQHQHQQLNDIVQNSYFPQGVSQQCALSLVAEVESHLPNLNGPFNSVIGLRTQSSIERILMDDSDLAPIAAHHVPGHSNRAASVSEGPTVSFTPLLAGGEHCTPHSLRPSLFLQAPQVAQEWRSVEGSLFSPGGSKHELDPRNQPQQNAGKKWKIVGPKCKRTTEPADHILRERQRRDDMTHKFSILESILPPGAKRDRSTTVDDSIEYVKNLHHRIKELHRRKAEIIKTATGALSSEAQRKTPTQRDNRLTSLKGQVEIVQPENDDSGQMKKVLSEKPKYPVSKEELEKFHVLFKSCVEKLEMRVDLPDQVLIEINCRPLPHLQSKILQCLERLGLDVTEFSITKVGQYLICVISAKPRWETSYIVSTCGILATLKYALGMKQQLSSDEEYSAS